MRNPSGYVTIVCPTATTANFDKFRCEEIPAGTYEADTFQCGHCGSHRHVKARVSMDEFGSMCRNCMKMTCPTCADGPCKPFLKKIEEMEQKDYVRKQYESLF